MEECVGARAGREREREEREGEEEGILEATRSTDGGRRRRRRRRVCLYAIFDYFYVCV